tara:strand:- start:2287 stop:2610 length:324 start_codon:yes stop_codon:yes gene_type:complete
MKNFFKLTKEDADFIVTYLPDSPLKNRLGDFTNNSPEKLYIRIEKLLVDNHLQTCWIPTIVELGELPGGFALVKAISEAGGLKKIRPEYARYLFSRDNSSQKPTYES